MNRKQKIIVSITGIFLVLMILVGLTYAYFLTKITGNTNEKSISVSTANLELVYGDGNNKILQNDTPLEPSSNVIGTKDFTVTNKGNSRTSYVVVIEDVVIKNTTDNTTTTFNSNDFRYTLICTKKDGTTCDGVSTQSVFPITGGIMVGNSIDVDDVQSYVLTLWYIDTGIDQSKDMGKSLQAKVNIKDITQVENPYSNNKKSLAYNIIENAKNKTNGTELLSNPKTIPGKEIFGQKYYTDKINETTSENTINISTAYQGYYWTYGTGYTINENTGKFSLTGVSTCKYNDGTCNETLVGKYIVASSTSANSSNTNIKKVTTNLSYINKVITAPASSTSTITMKVKKISPITYSIEEKELSITSDDYGTSYYYRGGVKDNYVNFAGMCWRIVRLQGDGSIKVILASELSCSENNLTEKSGYATDGAAGVQGTILSATYGFKIVENAYINDYINNAGATTENVRAKLNAWLERKITDNNDKTLLKNETWCIGDQTNGYDSTGKVIGTISDLINARSTFNFVARNKYFVLKKPSFKCETTGADGEIDINKIGMLTVDEVVYAGGEYNSNSNSNYYLCDNVTFPWLTLSPNMFTDFTNDLFAVNTFLMHSSNFNGTLTISEVVKDYSFRPSITLLSNTQISGGDGTINNAYFVS